GKPVLGLIPFIRDLKVQDEDSVSLDERRPGWGRKGEVRVVVVRLPRISNFTDFDPLETEEDVSLIYTVSPDELEGADLIVLPGTKNTVADLLFLKEKGLAAKIIEMRRRGVPVIGICGGFQMLGRKIKDPLGVESPFKEIEGLALLQASTTFEKEKATFQVKGVAIEDIPYLTKGETVEGYEIHMGRTEGSKFVFKLVRSNGEVVYDGMISEDALVFGTYLHGIFDNARFRRGILNFVRIRKGLEPIEPQGADLKLERLKEYDKLAEIVRENVDIGMIYRFMGLG
ncbi:TPA: cobyric acid synthase, partial [Candidatus Poribacteria bacterium]|nr:cobyric acid synthase [Candidatus Poribacteria bacterium]HEX29047.1 cobyric acid synthase [Candidatus Poribacteria bacterium]